MAGRFDLKGRVALVTGSGKGIGRAMALGLAEAGARVAIHGLQPQAELDTVAAEASAHGASAVAFHADIAAQGAGAALVEAVQRSLGAIDILVINASFEERRDWASVDTAYIDKHVAANFRATIELLQASVPDMARRGWGRVVSMGSIQEVKPNPALMAYAALKSAQTSLVLNLARQYAQAGVTLNNLAPGAIATDRNREVLSDPAYKARIESMIPAGRIGTPDDCVGACLLLCSDAGGYINGQTLFVDGGWHVS